MSEPDKHDLSHLSAWPEFREGLMESRIKKEKRKYITVLGDYFSLKVDAKTGKPLEVKLEAILCSDDEKVSEALRFLKITRVDLSKITDPKYHQGRGTVYHRFVPYYFMRDPLNEAYFKGDPFYEDWEREGMVK